MSTKLIKLFETHPIPWKLDEQFTQYDLTKGQYRPGISDANGEYIVGAYYGGELVDILWEFYNYYVSKEGGRYDFHRKQ